MTRTARSTEPLATELYRAGLAVAEHLIALDPASDSPEGKLLVTLATALENYERHHFPNLFPRPNDATPR